MITKEMVHAAIVDSVDGFDVSTLADDAEFSDAGLDSLDHSSILLELQEKYGLVVEDEEIKDCRSVSGILAFAAKKGI